MTCIRAYDNKRWVYLVRTTDGDLIMYPVADKAETFEDPALAESVIEFMKDLPEFSTYNLELHSLNQ